jgi:hypothetical protein
MLQHFMQLTKAAKIVQLKSPFQCTNSAGKSNVYRNNYISVLKFHTVKALPFN